MSKSLEFCKQAASDQYADRDWSCTKEFDPTNLFDQFLHEIRRWNVIGELDDKEIKVSCTLEINPEADFEFFVSDSSIHDGTLLFIRECMDQCVYKIVSLQSIDEKIGAPEDGDTLHYVVGNLVVLSEYDMDGTRFAPADRRWLHERTTVLLPVKMWREDRNGHITKIHES